MYTPITPEDFITINPKGDLAEFVIRSKYISELNEPTKDKDALVFIVDPDLPVHERKKQTAAIAIEEAEYNRLKYRLTGDMKMTPEEMREAYDRATGALTVADEVTALKKKTTKKGGTSKK